MKRRLARSYGPSSTSLDSREGQCFTSLKMRRSSWDRMAVVLLPEQEDLMENGRPHWDFAVIPCAGWYSTRQASGRHDQIDLRDGGWMHEWDLIDCVIEYSESCHPSTTFKGKRASITAIQYIRIKGKNQIDAIPRQELPETSPVAGQCSQSQSNGDAGRKVIQGKWRSRTHAKRVPGASLGERMGRETKGEEVRSFTPPRGRPSCCPPR
jgi:hypothetical protein